MLLILSDPLHLREVRHGCALTHRILVFYLYPRIDFDIFSEQHIHEPNSDKTNINKDDIRNNISSVPNPSGLHRQLYFKTAFPHEKNSIVLYSKYCSVFEPSYSTFN